MSVYTGRERRSSESSAIRSIQRQIARDDSARLREVVRFWRAVESSGALPFDRYPAHSQSERVTV